MENNKKVCEGCECSCHDDKCRGCYGGGRHYILRWVLGIIIIFFVFWGGFKIGLIVGSVNGGYGYPMHGFRSMMGRDGYSNYGPWMMYGWTATDKAPTPTTPAE